jgi:autotransporter translocation and assembly factor TamB
MGNAIQPGGLIPRIATLTVRRPDVDITVELQLHEGEWVVITSLDEDGYQVLLTAEEKTQVKARADAGEDETGY